MISDRLIIRITSSRGNSFLDRMIALIEGAERQKTPNEIALNILLVGLTIIFVFAVASIPSFAAYAGGTIGVIALVALFVTLIPTTIGALLSAIGIAGMDRLVRFNVLAMSGRAVEAAGDVDTLLLDKTGTITLGNRQATEFLPVRGVTERDLADAAQLASLADETPEGRSIVVLAKEKHGLRERDMAALGARFVPFTAQTRMSGVDVSGNAIRKGAVDAVLAYVGAPLPQRRTVGLPAPQPVAVPEAVREVQAIAETHRQGRRHAARGGEGRPASRRRRAQGHRQGRHPRALRRAAPHGHPHGDDHRRQPDDRRRHRRRGRRRRLPRRGDAGGEAAAHPRRAGQGQARRHVRRRHQRCARALAQADVGVAMNTGTVAAREAGNMVDLDSDPTKLIEVVEIGKQLLMTRGSLTTFSIANDVAKYFAIIPAMFAVIYPQLGALNVMGLATPESAILSAIIFNALVIIALIPLALRGVTYRAIGAGALLRRNLAIYGLGGLIVPFIGIKLIDLAITAIGLA